MKQLSIMHDSALIRLIQIALAEDIGSGDITSEALISAESLGRAQLIVKAPGVVAGTIVAGLVFGQVDPDISCDWNVKEGDRVEAGTSIATVQGSLRGILTAERIALNFLQRMSGVATLTRTYVDAVAGTGAIILDTRKTIPGWRGLDKYAVAIGGGVNHRLGLYDMIMIKDNHIAAYGSIAGAVRSARATLAEWGQSEILIEVETTNLVEVAEAMNCEGVSRIMFDNFPLAQMREAVVLVGDRCQTEASGGVNLDTVREIAETGVRYISVGALTHSAPALDISLDLRAA